ncbi:phosphonopyruvate decarboxylase [Desulfobacca acetoxidans]|uniref:Phosphonopyruvate decarboxylase n=1 Tax=Desulfobacca acetoxidans (strain ATCC 700848 / DSM 11109 / ASRB2) TaxID=880072 RepID=F2NFH4_DESAR|nr:phosphonopyruvate decarboxylase [Desulfobacca acetoxidans]AEB10093.1 phosphonopyruvate decarboxylase [Desulfobacca acetoxidans DSM 11109]
MVDAIELIEFFDNLGFGPYTGVPCSLLNPLISYLERDSNRLYVAAASEGEAMGIAAGWNLAGRQPVILMQNSGFGNAVNPLTSLQLIYHFPCLLVISWRGEPGRPDAVQHRIMGLKMPGLLALLGLSYTVLTGDWEVDREKLQWLQGQMTVLNQPAALIVPRGTIAPVTKYIQQPQRSLKRQEAIAIICQTLRGDELLISTTGKISRELYNTKDAGNNFYMVGSMGCASAIGLGLALAQPQRRVVVLDGDGACLMKMGNLSTIGHYRPANLIHLVLDNEAYDSTGGQASNSATASLSGVAKEAGYRTAQQVSDPEALTERLQTILGQPGPHFLLIKVATGAAVDLPRPSLTPPEMKDRFQTVLKTYPRI